jgi:preprotein translocase subunit YajC
MADTAAPGFKIEKMPESPAAHAESGTTALTHANPLAPAPPSALEVFAVNAGLIAVLVLLFYLLLILPQQKRFKRHRAMLGGIKKGDEVITAAGFVARVVKVEEEGDRIILDLGKGVEVTALRSTVHAIANRK